MSADFLLSLLDRVDIPGECDDCGDISFDLGDGWNVTLFYDVGELDYIDHFTKPDGEVIDFWNWPPSGDRDRLINWRGKN